MGSPQAEVHPALLAESDVHVPTKKTLDSFLYSDLDLVLGRMFQPENLIIAGVNTDTCVYSTTFSAANRGYRPIVVRDCCASMRGVDRHEMALTLMSRSMAWVFDLDELLARIDPSAAG
jgi:nicotinamidase-related amidase